MRAMLGGAVDPEMASRDPQELIAIVRADLKRLLGLVAEPIFTEVVPWPRAIPQYILGHRERVARIEEELKGWIARGGPPIALAGNAMDGVAFGKAAARGWRVGAELLDGWVRSESAD